MPRTFALRDAIETASAATAVDDVKKVLDHSMVMCGNNIHVSAPFTGEPVPAAVFEWDADTAQDGGATLRVSAVRGGAKLNQAVFCTNHHRLRKTPQSCNRYEEIESRLLSAGQEGQKLDVASAESIMKAVSVPGTLQSVIFLPNRREFYLRLATNKHNATDSQSVHFRLDDLLKKTP